MKISYNWLTNYISNLPSPEKTAELLTGCGLEVESIEKYETVKGGLAGCVIGEVKTKEKHPDADRLSLTTVDIGSGTLLNIVCGASNVVAGQKVVVATIGSTLYPVNGEPIVLKKAKIRGALSEGMICAEDELGLGASHDGIMVLDPAVKTGTLAKDHFKIESDHIFEIGLTPNRSDAASHIGVARDLAALTGSKVITPEISSFAVKEKTINITVKIEDGIACPRYSALCISGIKAGESPAWLRKKLNAIGIRSINNIVDITNFVLHECGQPLHAFDADKISGKKVIVKKLPAKTKFRTLDGIDRELKADDLMICDAEKGLCIAGVFGGEHSSVTAATQNIFLESAYFDPKHVRRTAKHHGLKTDASFRFERGADPDITVYALKRAALLISEIAGGRAASEITDVYPAPVLPASVELTYSGLEKIAGKKLSNETVQKILLSLNFKIIDQKDSAMVLAVPTYKTDVKRECDVIEEVLRIYGLDNIEIPEQMVSSISFSMKPDREQLRNKAANSLSAGGFREIFTNSLSNDAYYEGSASKISISNPFSAELNVMRETLMYNGLEVIAYNRNRKNLDLLLYEFGNVYACDPKKRDDVSGYAEEEKLGIFLTGHEHSESWYEKQRRADIYQMKAHMKNCLRSVGLHVSFSAAENTFSACGTGMNIFHEKNVIGSVGMVNKNILKKFDIAADVYFSEISWEKVMNSVKNAAPVFFKEIPKFPGVRRDLAMILDKGINYSELESLAFETEKKLLTKVDLFDVYEGEKIGKDKKSYAMSFFLQDVSATLTDQQVEKTMERLMKAYKEKLGADIRS